MEKVLTASNRVKEIEAEKAAEVVAMNKATETTVAENKAKVEAQAGTPAATAALAAKTAPVAAMTFAELDEVNRKYDELRMDYLSLRNEVHQQSVIASQLRKSLAQRQELISDLAQSSPYTNTFNLVQTTTVEAVKKTAFKGANVTAEPLPANATLLQTNITSNVSANVSCNSSANASANATANATRLVMTNRTANATKF
jgi:uncharacterized coiled-coil DUF342 family protein